jgi:hypothetical protein
MKVLTGRKTYLVAAALIALGCWMVWRGSVSEGSSVILFGLGFTSLGDRANRHQAEILQAIQDAGKVALEIRADAVNPADVAKLVGDAVRLSGVNPSPAQIGMAIMPPLTDDQAKAVHEAVKEQMGPRSSAARQYIDTAPSYVGIDVGRDHDVTAIRPVCGSPSCGCRGAE